MTRAGYYAWRRRPLSARREQDRQLLERIRAIFAAHDGKYGSPRIYRDLRSAGWRISRRRVERLMRTAGLRGRVARVYRASRALNRFYHQHPNRVRHVTTTAPNQIWLGDITYIPVATQWWLLAVILDLYSRRVLAWTLARHRGARLTCAVLNAAVRPRLPNVGLIFHSDRATEYSAAAFRDRLRQLGALQSAALTGPGENAHMESFFHSLKAELVHGTRFETEAELRSALRRYFHYYNHQRHHSALGYRSPVDYEAAAA